MFILILFAFLAGMATIFAPCILPILPIVLSAGLTGNRQRPLGIVSGLVISFTFFTLSLSFLTSQLGISPDLLRAIAIALLFAFGLLLVVPAFLQGFEKLVSRLIPVPKEVGTGRSDFLSGLLVGFSLGLVWTPCVGPIMASVITLAATSGVTLESVFITLAYVLGVSIPLLLITYGGQQLLQKVGWLKRHTPHIQMGFGVIMILTSLAMAFGYDRTIQTALLAKLPSEISTGLTQSIEQSSTVQNQLKDMQGSSNIPLPESYGSSALPRLGQAPELAGITHWLNSDPLTLAQLKGKVVLIDFWTFSCVNCIRTLPHVTGWYDSYKDQGLVVVGVHAPEFAFEKETANVADAIKQYAIHYPVAQDNNFATWQAYSNQYWPAEYLIDATGQIRATHFGEGNYEEMDANIRGLLKEAKQSLNLPAGPSLPDQTPHHQQSPETYLGTDRREGYAGQTAPESLKTNNWTLEGKWNESNQNITSQSEDAALSYRFIGQDVYLVLNRAEGHTGQVQVYLDGALLTGQTGTDVGKDGVISVNEDRLYHLVYFGAMDNQSHLLKLQFKTPGLKAFAFTFG